MILSLNGGFPIIRAAGDMKASMRSCGVERRLWTAENLCLNFKLVRAQRTAFAIGKPQRRCEGSSDRER